MTNKRIFNVSRDTYLEFAKVNSVLAHLENEERKLTMKNWDVTLAQIPLVAVGIWYIYMAINSFFYSRLYYQPQSGFIFGMTIGTVLIGIALALQEVRRYRAKKSFLNVPNTHVCPPPNQEREAVMKEPVVMAICPGCKNRIPSTTNFCPECGADLRLQDT